MNILNSPMTTDKIAKANISFNSVRIFNQRIYYTMSLPSENSRITIISANFDGTDKRNHLPKQYSVKSRINIYGGASLCVTNNGIVFSDNKTSMLYIIRGDKITALTKNKKYFYADVSYCDYSNTILYVAEENFGNRPKQHIEKLNLNTMKIKIVACGADFYHAPTAHNNNILWLEWDLPHMPWDNSSVVKKTSTKQQTLSSGSGHFQPSFDKDGNVYYVNDSTGYFNLYKNGINISPINTDFAYPLWIYGMKTYGFTENSIVATGVKNGLWSIGEIKDNKFNKYLTQFTTFESIVANGNICVFIGGRTNDCSAVVCINNGVETIIEQGSPLILPTDYISIAKQITFKNKDGNIVHANYYSPSNPQYDNSTLSPLIVKSHGGPTGQADISFNPKIQFWTSRGFAVLDVNYSGSTGFGTDYRNRLLGKWGELNVSELESGAKWCIDQKLANPEQLIVSGSSAGGLAVLSALTFGNTFKTGCSIYGISELANLAEETHKFESNYFDVLIAPYKDNKNLYKQRSPLYSSHNISVPVLFLHGDQDMVVPSDQSEAMYDLLTNNNIYSKLITYVGEGHGFKNSKVIAHALNTELEFYRIVFNEKSNQTNINISVDFN